MNVSLSVYDPAPGLTARCVFSKCVAGYFVELAVNIVVLSAIYALIACVRADLSGQPRTQSCARRTDDAGSLSSAGDGNEFAGHPAAAIAAAVVMSLVVGILVYVFLMRKMTGEMVLAAVLAGARLAPVAGVDGAHLVPTAAISPSQALGFANPAIALPGGGRISTFAAILVMTTALVYAALFVFLRFGRWVSVCGQPDKSIARGATRNQSACGLWRGGSRH